MATSGAEPTIHIAAIHFGVPTVWVDEFETTDRHGDRVVVIEWTGALDHDGNVMDGNRCATGFRLREDGAREDRIVNDLDVPQPSNVRAAMDALHTR